MARGLLEIRGSLDPDELWPAGRADADPLVVRLDPRRPAFRFRPRPAAPLAPTRAFEGAIAVGRIRRPVIDDRGSICVRLQGVDAPELHDRAAAAIAAAERSPEQAERFRRSCAEYRQPLAESAPLALRRLHHPAGRAILGRAIAAIDEPAEAVDCHGRVVGDLSVRLAGRRAP